MLKVWKTFTFTLFSHQERRKYLNTLASQKTEISLKERTEHVLAVGKDGLMSMQECAVLVAIQSFMKMSLAVIVRMEIATDVSMQGS